MRSTKKCLDKWLEVSLTDRFKNRAEIICKQAGISVNRASRRANTGSAPGEDEMSRAAPISIKFRFNPNEVIEVNGNSPPPPFSENPLTMLLSSGFKRIYE
jgi:hypothetical protein